MTGIIQITEVIHNNMEDILQNTKGICKTTKEKLYLSGAFRKPTCQITSNVF
jgi:hypothetical protein